MRFLLPTALLVSSGCSAGNANELEHLPRKMASNTLNDEDLRLLFSSTYVTPVRSSDIIIDHPPGELFRPNGTYRRILGRTGLEGTFAIENGVLCVMGPEIERLCRRVLPRGGKIFLMTDISNESQVFVEIAPVK